MDISLNDAYSLKNPEDNRALYAKWAKTYESDFVKNQGYEHPKIIAEHFHLSVSDIHSCVDVGTGTGLVGYYLKLLRPELSIDGLDISPEMLAEAKAKGVYRNLYERDLTQTINNVAAPYDALICIGIFTHGHLPKESIENLLPLVRENGSFVIGINAQYFKESDFEEFLGELFENRRISKPKYKNVHVYSQDSPHRDSLNVIAEFQRI